MSNRDRMPKCAAWVDEMRGVFGEVKVSYASENNIVLGEAFPPGVIPTRNNHGNRVIHNPHKRSRKGAAAIYIEKRQGDGLHTETDIDLFADRGDDREAGDEEEPS
jgi:hypothetical protein